MIVAKGKISTRKGQGAYDVKTVQFISRLQSVLNLSDSYLADVLKLEITEYDKFKEHSRPVKISELIRLADHFNFSVEAFSADQVDFEILRQQHIKNFNYLPEKYTFQAFSKKRLLQTVSSYLGLYFHWSIKEDLFRYFQIQDIDQADPNDRMNVYLFEDVLKYLRTVGLGETQIFNIGIHSVESSRRTTFEESLSTCLLPNEMFEKYFSESILLIEKNNRYQITKLNYFCCEVESHEIPDLLDAFRVRKIAGKERCIYRKGALSAVTRYIGFEDSKVTETHCVHDDGSCCKYLIQFGRPYLKNNNNNNNNKMICRIK